MKKKHIRKIFHLGKFLVSFFFLVLTHRDFKLFMGGLFVITDPPKKQEELNKAKKHKHLATKILHNTQDVL